MSGPQIAVGTELIPLRVPAISRSTLALFAGASGDHEPVHLDIDYARRRGLDDVIAHGMLSMAYLSRLLLGFVPQARIRSYSARFVAVTPVNAEPTCTGRVVSVEDGIATVVLFVRLGDGTETVRGEALIDAAP